MARRRLIATVAGLVLGWPAAAGAADRLLLVRGQWAALASPAGDRCRAIARTPRRASGDRAQAFAALSFDRSGARRGELFVRLSRTARSGATIMLMIGGRPFLLVGAGQRAWSSGPAQEAAIIAAMRSSAAMRIIARDRSGRRFSDHYRLAGAPSAIDAAAAACAGNW